jgi:hypothetical protein
MEGTGRAAGVGCAGSLIGGGSCVIVTLVKTFSVGASDASSGARAAESRAAAGGFVDPPTTVLASFVGTSSPDSCPALSYSSATE